MLGGLVYDPVPPLLGSGDPAVRYFARRDLCGEPVGPIRELWSGRDVGRILGRQLDDGRWSYRGGNRRIRSADSYDQLETFRQLNVLVHKYAMTRRHPAVERAAQFLFTFHTEVGDYRGIYGNQYSPNYSAAITEVLIRAGFARDPRVRATLRWLSALRQDDGGWAIPARTRKMSLAAMLSSADVVEPDRAQPSAHLITGIVLRAFAAHVDYRRSALTRRAGELLASRLFKRDSYSDHAAASYWFVFSFPYWWTDLLSALDTLRCAGFSARHPAVARGVAWFSEHQQPDGLWNSGANRPKGPYADHWVALAACRMLTTI